MTDAPDLGALFGAPDTETFLGLAPCPDPGQVSASSAFIGAPAATPYGSVGAYARGGPASLRRAAAALAANLDRHNFDLGGPTFPDGARPAVDCGDLPWSETDFATNRATIRNAVTKVAGRGAVPILIGGDDSVPIPMIEAMGDIGTGYTILQIDAHIDWRHSHMGERLGLSSTMRRASEMGHIKQIIQVGARGIGSAHGQDVADALAWGAQLIPARQFHQEGAKAALDLIPRGAGIILCIDIDAMDPAIAPNTIGRTPGGLSYDQMLDLVLGAATRGRIAAVDVVEILPEMDIGGIGGLTVSRLIATLMGVLARQDMAARGAV